MAVSVQRLFAGPLVNDIDGENVCTVCSGYHHKTFPVSVVCLIAVLLLAYYYHARAI